jgi:hypothetical protein
MRSCHGIAAEGMSFTRPTFGGAPGRTTGRASGMLAVRPNDAGFRRGRGGARPVRLSPEGRLAALVLA